MFTVFEPSVEPPGAMADSVLGGRSLAAWSPAGPAAAGVTLFAVSSCRISQSQLLRETPAAHIQHRQTCRQLNRQQHQQYG